MSQPALEVRERSARFFVQDEPALIREFDLFATSPSAIAKLRELILSLAVRGKLVLQNQEDEPAGLALGRMEAMKARLIADGKIKQDKTDADIADGEMPFRLPPGWAWARLNQMTAILNGRAYAKQELLDSGTPVLRVGNLFTSKHWYYSNLTLEEAKYCAAGDLLFAWSASFGPFIWPGPKAIYHYHIWKLALHSDADLDKSFLYTFLLEKTQEMKASGHGVSMIHMTKEAMEKIVVPVPPLAEQHRIVARVEELMKLCDALEQSGRLSDEQHARLTSTLFDALAASDSARALAENWQRIAEHFDLLLDRPEAIDALEQTILQLAVRGLLVAQGERAIQARAVAVTASFEDIEISSMPLPAGWEAVGFLDVCSVSGGSTPSKARADFWNGHVPWVSPKDMKRDVIGDAIDHISERALAQTSLSLVPTGSVLVVVRGMILAHSFPVAITSAPVTINQDMKALSPRKAELAPYLALVCKGFKREILSLVERSTHGTCKLESTKLFGWRFGLPPLAEQHRIVARVEELRRLCAQLRERLTAARRTQSELANALVAEAG
ncbi:MAG TPA: restriction endonuclease subunit S [Burkholderiaceae bacterium]|nr:restriction endonuclease subunit S [Burkholderiaceae bacterium]